MKYLQLALVLLFIVAACAIPPVSASEPPDDCIEFIIYPSILMNAKYVVKPANGGGPIFTEINGFLPHKFKLPANIDDWIIEYYSGFFL